MSSEHQSTPVQKNCRIRETSVQKLFSEHSFSEGVFVNVLDSKISIIASVQAQVVKLFRWVLAELFIRAFLEVKKTPTVEVNVILEED